VTWQWPRVDVAGEPGLARAYDSGVFRQATGTIDARHRGFFAEAGDARQVWARRGTGEAGGVFFLDEGGVTEEVRRECSEGRLVCPMADCPDPRFIARGGEVRRHHFAHRVAHVKHATAAVWRAEAMTMLADWAGRYRGAEVDAHDGEHVAAVRVRSQRTGREVELQVTYDRRFEPPLEQLHDPARQLLVGHTRGLLLPRTPCPELRDAWWCGTSRLVGELLLWGGWAIAVNPEQRLVATLVDAYAALRAGLLPRAARTPHPLLCLVCKLDRCRLTGHGLETPTTQRLTAEHARESAQRAQTRTPARPPPERAAAAPASPEHARHATPGDARQAEYLRRAQGLSTEQRLALLKEMFLPRDAQERPGKRADRP